MVPTIGRIVHYRLSARDANAINRRRVHASSNIDYHRWKKNGTQVHVGNSVSEGDEFPMMIVRVWGEGENAAVNGQVFLDGADVLWATSVTQGDKPGAWHEPEPIVGKISKANAAAQFTGSGETRAENPHWSQCYGATGNEQYPPEESNAVAEYAEPTAEEYRRAKPCPIDESLTAQAKENSAHIATGEGRAMLGVPATGPIPPQDNNAEEQADKAAPVRRVPRHD